MCTWMCTRAARVCRTRGLDCPCRSDGGGSLERAHLHTAHTGSVWTSSSRRRTRGVLWSVCSVWTLIVSDSRTDTRRCKQTRGVGGGGTQTGRGRPCSAPPGFGRGKCTRGATRAERSPQGEIIVGSATPGFGRGWRHGNCTRGTQPPINPQGEIIPSGCRILR